MKLDDLAHTNSDQTPARRGGVCVVSGELLSAKAKRYFSNGISSLALHEFWRAADEENTYRPKNGLWAPQRRAIGVCLAYLGARSEGVTAESALIKMPTGTGKTAVIATLACAVPQVRRTLIITPRQALVDQLLEDVHWGFWSNFGLAYDGQSIVDAKSTSKPTSSKEVGVHRLLPSTASKTVNADASQRLVVVGTFKALEQIVRPARPAHRLSGAARRSDGDAHDGSSIDSTDADKVRDALSNFDLVIVDEGHYEPAFVWSQCIRDLKCPTVLLSATPYRNDFKYFSVRGNFAFNLSYQEAIKEKLIRPVNFAAASARPRDSSPKEFVVSLIKYYADVIQKSPWQKGGEPPRVIVRAQDHESLLQLKAAFKSVAKSLPVVLIHDKVTKDDPAKLEFCSASAALNSAATEGVTYWLHQWKLLEGVDENAFLCVAVYQPFSNSRAAIQQLGRVLRFRDSTRQTNEVASLFASNSICEELGGRLGRYMKFEEYFNQDPRKALAQEARLPSVILKDAPEFQYLFGDFCSRLPLDDVGSPSFADFKLPFRTTVFHYSGALSLDQLTERCKDAMGLEERYEVRLIRPSATAPQNVRLVIYLTWENSPLLVRHSFPLWGLGLMAIVQVGSRVFMYDTNGLVIDVEKLELEPESPDVMRKLVPASSDTEPWRVGQASAVGLDLSDTAVRSVSARMHDFSDGFFDLAQTNQALNALRAHGRRKKRAFSRYLSLGRSAISDSDSVVEGNAQGIEAYAKWVEEVARTLDASVTVSNVFDRFAQCIPAPSKGDAAPINVLFDFSEARDSVPPVSGWRTARLEALLNAEVCVDVATDGSFTLTVDGEPITGTLQYAITGSIHRRGRYVVQSAELDDFVVDSSDNDAPSFVKVLNKAQAIRVVSAAPDLTYAKKTFYRTGLDIAALARGIERGTPLEYLKSSAWMQQVSSEKGEGGMAKWVSDSIFGGLYAHFDRPMFGRRNASHTTRPIRTHDSDLADELDKFDLVVCDDGGKEWADFMMVNSAEQRVVFVHAKVNDSSMSLNSMQVVGRQAQASLPFMVRGSRLPNRATWWTSPWSTDDSRQVTHRILRATTNDLNAVWAKVEQSLQSTLFRKEIWIWAGRSLSKGKLLKELTKAGGPTPHARQMAYYLGSLQTSAARASVGMLIYCSP